MIAALVMFALYVVVLGVVLWLLIYLVDTVPMFQPFREVARTIIIVFGIILLILLLLGLIGIVDTGTPRLVIVR